MDLFPVGHQGVPRQRVVVFPAGQLTNAADLAIDEADRGKVGTHQVVPLVRLLEEFQTRLGKLPMEVPREARRVVAVVALHGRELQRFLGIHVVPLLGDVARHVRQEETGGQEKGFLHIAL